MLSLSCVVKRKRERGFRIRAISRKAFLLFWRRGICIKPLNPNTAPPKLPSPNPIDTASQTANFIPDKFLDPAIFRAASTMAGEKSVAVRFENPAKAKFIEILPAPHPSSRMASSGLKYLDTIARSEFHNPTSSTARA